MYKCVQPGDIILARVLGYGDNSTAYLLSTAEDELGVVSARGENGEKLVPETSESVKSNKSEYRETRKVALIPNLNI